jgi:hypothetical protein
MRDNFDEATFLVELEKAFKKNFPNSKLYSPEYQSFKEGFRRSWNEVKFPKKAKDTSGETDAYKQAFEKAYRETREKLKRG